MIGTAVLTVLLMSSAVSQPCAIPPAAQVVVIEGHPAHLCMMLLFLENNLRPLKSVNRSNSCVWPQEYVRAPLLVTYAPIVGTIGTTVPLRHNYPIIPQMIRARKTSVPSFRFAKCSDVHKFKLVTKPTTQSVWRTLSIASEIEARVLDARYGPRTRKRVSFSFLSLIHVLENAVGL